MDYQIKHNHNNSPTIFIMIFQWNMFPKDTIYFPIIHITSSDIINILEYKICNEIKYKN